MSEYIFPNKTPVSLLRCEQAFNILSEKEKLYAHYLARAAWIGHLICVVQRSPESPLIFSLLHKLFCDQSAQEFKKNALSQAIATEEDVDAFIIYTAAVFYNCGNYKQTGSTKIIPNLPKETFEDLLRSSNFAQNDPVHFNSLLSKCLDVIYSLKDCERRLGFPDSNTTSYFSKNVFQEDTDVVANFFKCQNMEAVNTRLFKMMESDGSTTYEIRLGSVLKNEDNEGKELLKQLCENSHKFVVSRGDYSKLLEQVNKHLELAMEYASNEKEVHIIENYIKSFRTGSVDAHKEASRYWIKDKGPIVENYIGFVETYNDPAGVRADFRGTICLVDKERSKKFDSLVKSAEELLPLLPWPSSFEKDKFLKPDFTSVDIFAAGGFIAAGQCIPNYTEIRQNEGFKNLSFGNVCSMSFSDKKVNYVNESDQELVNLYGHQSFELQVGLHELLGHGSGKYFKREKDGTFNFDTETVLNYETNEKISSWYEPGETPTSVFGKDHNHMEECRAECVGLYLCTVPEAFKVFNHEGSVAEDVWYVNWLDTLLRGLAALQMYDLKSGAWLQAHCQARFVILQVCLEAGKGLVKIEEIIGDDGEPDLLLTLDRSKVTTVGRKAVANLLRRIQLYKATGDKKSSVEMFAKYSAVKSEDSIYPFLRFREIVLARKKPRTLLVLANSVVKDGKVDLNSYEETPEGLIQSFVERYPDIDIHTILEEIWDEDQVHFT